MFSTVSALEQPMHHLATINLILIFLSFAAAVDCGQNRLLAVVESGTTQLKSELRIYLYFSLNLYLAAPSHSG